MYQLRDDKGRFVNCCALGRHAGSEVLSVGNVIVMYFATARKNIGGQGQLWLYDDSHVVKLRERVQVPWPPQLKGLASLPVRAVLPFAAL